MCDEMMTHMVCRLCPCCCHCRSVACPTCVHTPAAEQFGNKAPFTPIDPGLCADADPNCKGWAKSGECERNAKFMTGDLGNPGACSLSCGKCKPCAKVRALSGAGLSHS